MIALYHNTQVSGAISVSLVTLYKSSFIYEIEMFHIGIISLANCSMPTANCLQRWCNEKGGDTICEICLHVSSSISTPQMYSIITLSPKSMVAENKFIFLEYKIQFCNMDMDDSINPSVVSWLSISGGTGESLAL